MKRIAKVLGITSIISALHLVEDVVLFIVGRYTDVTIYIVLVGVLTLSLILALLSRIKRVKHFLGH